MRRIDSDKQPTLDQLLSDVKSTPEMNPGPDLRSGQSNRETTFSPSACALEFLAVGAALRRDSPMEVSVFVVRAFVQMRELLSGHMNSPQD